MTVKTEKNEVGMLHPDGHIGGDLDVNHPKIVYMPTEINFEKLNSEICRNIGNIKELKKYFKS